MEDKKTGKGYRPKEERKLCPDDNNVLDKIRNGLYKCPKCGKEYTLERLLANFK